MGRSKRSVPAEKPDDLFGRIVSILEQARGNVVRAVNTNMVLAYWLIGREIVQDLQGGEERAAYGAKVIEDLSARLTQRYGKGFSTPVLMSFRQFYLAYSDRDKILFPPGRELADTRNPSPVGRELSSSPNPDLAATEAIMPQIVRPAGAEISESAILHPHGGELPQRFSPQLSWSHYRASNRSSPPNIFCSCRRKNSSGRKSKGNGASSNPT
jgi:hypothetical protein